MTSREERFRRLFDRNYRKLMAYALRRTGSTADAEDVVSETLAVAWRRFDAVPATDHEQTLWLYGVARRTLGNHRRGAGRAARLSLRLAGDVAAAAIDGHLDDATDIADALMAMGELNEADQELLMLALWEDLTHAEIAVVTGTSVANVAVRLHRAKRRLRASFARLDRSPGRRDGREVITPANPRPCREQTR